MSKSKRVCKICGVEYPYCTTENRGNRFRYQDVACCKEHGIEYFKKVLKHRGENFDDLQKAFPEFKIIKEQKSKKNNIRQKIVPMIDEKEESVNNIIYENTDKEINNTEE